MAKSQGENYISKIRRGIQNGFLNDHYGSFDSIAILLDSPNNNQAYYYAAIKGNNFINKNPYIELSLYICQNSKPSFFSQLPIYTIDNLKSYTGIGVATSLLTLDYLDKSNIKNKYFYVYNLAEMFYLNKEQIEALKASNIKLFTRNDDYAKILENYFGFQIESIRVPDFNLEKMCRVLGINNL